jgi:type VI secretion system protein ImpB
MNHNTIKPRVHIKYEVETENGIEEKELPFVIGVIGDFSGHTQQPPFKSRSFLEINANNIIQWLH